VPEVKTSLMLQQTCWCHSFKCQRAPDHKSCRHQLYASGRDMPDNPTPRGALEGGAHTLIRYSCSHMTLMLSYDTQGDVPLTQRGANPFGPEDVHVSSCDTCAEVAHETPDQRALSWPGVGSREWHEVVSGWDASRYEPSALW
jgi:hypothetical protein